MVLRVSCAYPARTVDSIKPAAFTGDFMAITSTQRGDAESIEPERLSQTHVMPETAYATSMGSRRALKLAVMAVLCLPGWSAEPGYIDASVCAGCHRQAAAGYARSGMARTFGVVRAGTEAAMAPPGQFRHNLTEQDYAVSKRDRKSTRLNSSH